MTQREKNTMLNQVNSTEYISQICNQNPYIILKTQCGTGRYSFQNISYKNNELMLEFKLINDDNYEDTQNIAYNIGNMCFLTASQYLYAFEYQAYA
ncbi:hypothetical protein N9263_01100 [Candidatus Marinimicrobia bacterium]|nr:hypothetical protein [Candidatus Neomarinimicrobiota bacterium]